MELVPPEGSQVYVKGGGVAEVIVTVADPEGAEQLAGVDVSVVVSGIMVGYCTVEVAP